MAARDTLWRDHQRTRWLRPGAQRWIKPDANRFLKPGTAVAAIFQALDAKYSPNQPRVPAGNPRGGQWAREGGAGGGGSPGFGGGIAFGGEGGDIAFDAEGVDLGGLAFDDPGDAGGIASIFEGIGSGDSDRSGEGNAPSFLDLLRDRDDGRVQLASDTGNGNDLEPLPKIPETRPAESGDRTSVLKELGRWFGRNAGKATSAAGVIDGLAEQVDYIGKNTEAIKSYADPPRTLEELQARVSSQSERGYEDHHIVERSAKNFGISNERILSQENTVRIPVLKHYEINSYYGSNSFVLPDGSRTTPRAYLVDKTFEKRMEFGIQTLRRFNVLK